MLSLKAILYAVTKILKNNFDCDIFVEDNNIQGFEEACFFVQILPIDTTPSNKITNLKSLTVDVEYLQEAEMPKANLYDILNKLEKIFYRHIKVEDRYLNISSTEPQIIKDEIGHKLSYLIDIRYNDMLIEEINSTLMQEVNISLNNIPKLKE